MAVAERREGELVSVFGTSYENGVGEPFVDERPIRAQVSDDLTVAARRRLHGPAYSSARCRCAPDVVLPCPARAPTAANTTTRPRRRRPSGCSRPARRTARSRSTEHQTEGRGRLGRTWVDEPGTGLLFSVALLPPPPVARWPELTLVAAEAVAGAIGPAASIKHPNDVLVDGRKVAGILAEAQRTRRARDRHQRRPHAPGPAPARSTRDRLELLVEVLERLERGYESWLARVSR